MARRYHSRDCHLGEFCPACERRIDEVDGPPPPDAYDQWLSDSWNYAPDLQPQGL